MGFFDKFCLKSLLQVCSSFFQRFLRECFQDILNKLLQLEKFWMESLETILKQFLQVVLLENNLKKCRRKPYRNYWINAWWKFWGDPWINLWRNFWRISWGKYWKDLESIFWRNALGHYQNSWDLHGGIIVGVPREISEIISRESGFCVISKG